MKFKVELAEFHVIEVEAESREAAHDIVAVMDDEDILQRDTEDGGMVIWGITEVQHE